MAESKVERYRQFLCGFVFCSSTSYLIVLVALVPDVPGLSISRVMSMEHNFF